MIIFLVLLLIIVATFSIFILASLPEVSPDRGEVVIVFNYKKLNDFFVISAGETARIPFGYKITTMKLSQNSVGGTYHMLTHSLYWECEYTPDCSSIFSLNKAATTFLNYSSEDIEQMIDSAAMQAFVNANSVLNSITENNFYNQKDLDEILSSNLKYALSEIGYTGTLHAFIAPKPKA